MTVVTKNIAVDLGAGVFAEVTWSESRGWVLKWDDGVANEWSEEYEDRPVAIARLAALAYCIETNRIFLETNEDKFAHRAHSMLADATAWTSDLR